MISTAALNAGSSRDSVSAHSRVPSIRPSPITTMSINALTARTGSWAICTSSTTASPVTMEPVGGADIARTVLNDGAARD